MTRKYFWKRREHASEWTFSSICKRVRVDCCKITTIFHRYWFDRALRKQAPLNSSRRSVQTRKKDRRKRARRLGRLAKEEEKRWPRHSWPGLSDRWRWPLSSQHPRSLSLSLVSVIHHLGLFFTYFICNIFRNFYSVNRPPPPRRLPSSSSEPVTPRLSGPARKTTSCLVVHPPAHKGVARGWQRDGERRRRNGRRMKKGAVSPRVSSRVFARGPAALAKSEGLRKRPHSIC